MFLEGTPIERHLVGQIRVHVKRDDLYARLPAPPLGKLRGVMNLLTRLYAQGVRLIGCWDTRISALGQGVAACCSRFPEMRAIVAYPKTKGGLVPAQVACAEALGAEILPVVASRITISFAAARRAVEERGGVMLPFGMDCPDSVESVSRAAKTVPASNTRGGTVVVSAGSGVTLTGLVLGLPGRASRFVGVSAGRSPESILRCLRRYNIHDLDQVHVISAREPYNAPIDFACPFPCHPNYDRKAWRFLVENASILPQPLFFWNVGA